MRVNDFFLSIGLFIIAFIFGAFGTYSWFQSNFFLPVNPESKETQIFVVNKKDTLKKISENLEEQNLIRAWWNVYLFNSVRGDERANKILPGEYQLSASNTPLEILEKILGRKVFYRKLTIPEGTTSAEVAKLMSKTTLVELHQAQAAIYHPDLLAKLGINARSIEGYLFPETYQFTRPDSAEVMVTKMVEEGRKQIEEQIPDFAEKSIELGLNPYQVLILASIVEKETGKAEERPLIASVFHNRLRIGMPLQSDPTVIYGIPDFDGNLTKKHLRDKTNIFNTYVHPGLPPSPIANPGIEAIKAVVEPADSDYLYFVSKGDGSHKFSSSYKEHRKAVREFQKKK